jgi:hypothetical protein
MFGWTNDWVVFWRIAVYEHRILKQNDLNRIGRDILKWTEERETQARHTSTSNIDHGQSEKVRVRNTQQGCLLPAHFLAQWALSTTAFECILVWTLFVLGNLLVSLAAEIPDKSLVREGKSDCGELWVNLVVIFRVEHQYWWHLLKLERHLEIMTEQVLLPHRPSESVRCNFEIGFKKGRNGICNLENIKDKVFEREEEFRSSSEDRNRIDLKSSIGPRIWGCGIADWR